MPLSFCPSLLEKIPTITLPWLSQPIDPDFTKKNALKGKRIGVPRRVFLDDSVTGNVLFVNVVFEQASVTIKSLGTTIFDPADLPSADEIANSNNETIVLNIGFKACLLLTTFERFPRIGPHFPGSTRCLVSISTEERLGRQESRRFNCFH
jgi:hypothetical protein